MRFDHVTFGQRVLFGSGRVMVIASGSESSLAEEVTSRIDVAVFHDDVAPHVPIAHAEAARAVATQNSVDLLVCIGGGSTTGCCPAPSSTTRS